MFDLLAIGDTKLDVFIDLGKDAKVACRKDTQHCEISLKYGEKIPVDSAKLLPAGTAANIAIGLRRLGKKTALETQMGDDFTADLTEQLLKKEGVSVTHLHRSKKTKSSFSAILNFEGESTVLAVHEPHTYTLHQTLDAKCVVVGELGPGYKSLYRQLKLRKKQQPFFLALNPGSIQLEELDKTLYQLIACADILFLNKAEAERLTLVETNDIRQILRKLQRLGPKTVVVTDGKDGAYATEDGDIWYAPVFPGNRIEATGAGDAFTTGVLGALLLKKSLQTAIAWGAVNSASVVGFVGAHEGLLKKQALETQLTKAKSYRVKSL